METAINYMHYYLSAMSGEILSVFILLLFIVLRKIFAKYVLTWTMNLAAKTKNTWDEKLLMSFKDPLSFSFVVLGFYIAMQYWTLPPSYYIFATKISRCLIIFIVTWGLYNFTSSDSNFSADIKARLNVDDILIQFFSKVIRFIIVAIGILMIAQEFNYDVNGFIAGLGLGGLAFALAAKDALANVFGGIVVIVEKPFLIGDWIKTSTAEGTVEEITFRSTKIRAFDQAVITVPNATLANESITNYSRMGKRKISFYLGISRSTPNDKLEKGMNKIKTMITDHPGIHPDTILVSFEKFGDSSLEIMFYFYTNTTVWAEYLEIREDINLKIMQILAEEEIALAYPSQSIYLKNESL